MKIDLKKIKTITQEGIKKALDLEAAKKAEEERLRAEVEIKEKLRKKFDDSVKREKNNFKTIVLNAALEGWYDASTAVDLIIAPELKAYLSHLGFSCEILNKKDTDFVNEFNLLSEDDRKNATRTL